MPPFYAGLLREASFSLEGRILDVYARGPHEEALVADTAGLGLAGTARQTAGCRMLTIGEPDLDTPKEIREAAARAMEAGQTHYAPNQGTESLRRAIAAFETRRGRRTEAGEVLVTVGATQEIGRASCRERV